VSVDLTEFIAQLREQLSEAMRAGEEAELQFELGPIEMELTIAAEKAGGPNAKVRFWVVELGGDLKASSSTTQRIKLMLEPKRRGHQGRPTISGDEVLGER
jgi:hypothetical protein